MYIEYNNIIINHCFFVFASFIRTLVKKELQEGETLRISSGSLVAFTQDVDFGTDLWICLCVHQNL